MSVMDNARELGNDHGRNTATWVEDKEGVYRGFENCDPQVVDSFRTPLAGEWGGEDLKTFAETIGTEVGVDGWDEICDAYEEAFWEGFNDVLCEAIGIA